MEVWVLAKECLLQRNEGVEGSLKMSLEVDMVTSLGNIYETSLHENLMFSPK